MKSTSITLQKFLQSISDGDSVTFLAEQGIHDGTISEICSSPIEVKVTIDLGNSALFSILVKKENNLCKIEDGRNITLVSHQKDGPTLIVSPQI
jgi:hypothetical protein